MTRFNLLPFPSSVRRQASEDAAFAALQAFHRAERELAQPSRSRSILSIHADVQRTQSLAESLAASLAWARA